MIRIITSVVLAATVFVVGARAQEITDGHIEKAREIVSHMTLDEKIACIAGVRSDYTGYTADVGRLGIKPIRMADGPQGVRTDSGSTFYPSNILTAATWNRAMAREEGTGLGIDCRARGINVILGPAVNMYRSPLAGRGFEYMGEDPYLASEIALEYIKGVQEQGIMACVKHFACNNQEWDRNYASSDVDERTLQEIYLPAFRKAVVEGKVASVMDSYNLINGVWATENKWLNRTMLRDEWGFRGIVMSDWGAVHNSVAPVLGGLDLEMPTGRYLGKEALMPALASGVILEDDIDAMVVHILSTIIAYGWYDSPLVPDADLPLSNPANDARALEIAREGIVLLKNNGNVLPLKGNTVVIGPNADVMVGGGGSGQVYPFHYVTPYQGLKAVLGKKVSLGTVNPSSRVLGSECFKDEDGLRGFDVRWYNNREFLGAPVHVKAEEIAYSWPGSPYEGVAEDNFTTRVHTTFTAPFSGLVIFTIVCDDGARLFVDGEQVLVDWTDHEAHAVSTEYSVEAGREYDIVFEQYDGGEEAALQFRAELVDEESVKSDEYLGQFRKADNIVVCLGRNKASEGENSEHPFALPYQQRQILQEAAKLGRKVILVVNSGCNVDFAGLEPFADAVVMAWFPGQEGGTALAEILTGKVNPSGKLPITIENRWEDNPCADSYYFKEDPDYNGYPRVRYTEGIFMGYRGYDRNGTAVCYPFGYGLSYTRFEYSDISAELTGENEVTVSFNVSNTGGMDGKEVCEVYVSDPQCSVVRPAKELKGFEKVFLKKGETKRVSVILDSEAFHFYDVRSGKFVVEPGEFIIRVGGSSADLPLETSISI